jgi:RNA polymerase sigma-70 factor (ECF subfamily)
MYNTILSVLLQAEEAEEVTQDVFLEVWRNIERFWGDSALSTWLYRIAMNRSLDQVRKRKRLKRFAYVTSLLGINNEVKYHQPDYEHPGVLLENKERSAILLKAVEQLPERQRMAYVLGKMEGLSYKEISAIMGLSESAVDSLLIRARQNLKKDLEDYYRKNE